MFIVTGFGDAAVGSETSKSALFDTFILTEAELFDVSVSDTPLSDSIFAVFVIVPFPFTIAFIVTVTLSFLLNFLLP